MDDTHSTHDETQEHRGLMMHILFKTEREECLFHSEDGGCYYKELFRIDTFLYCDHVECKQLSNILLIIETYTIYMYLQGVPLVQDHRKKKCFYYSTCCFILYDLFVFEFL